MIVIQGLQKLRIILSIFIVKKKYVMLDMMFIGRNLKNGIILGMVHGLHMDGIQILSGLVQ
mgnify:CR=1 FL=1